MTWKVVQRALMRSGLVCLVLTGGGARAAVPQDELAGVKCEDLRAEDDANRRYFLIGPHEDAGPRKEGYRLLLVLPGGTGDADFNPFVKRIFQHATSKDYVVAQLVAPVWSEGQSDKVVWPVAKNRYPGMKFTTEEFIESVVTDVKSRVRVDPKSIFALAWSSGGPAVYAAAMEKKSSLTGAYVAMSVFKPEHMASLKNAKGMGFYLLHSPQDFIPIRHAETARDELAKARATTTLVEYEGGHGWHGDVYQRIRDGLGWLEKNHRGR